MRDALTSLATATLEHVFDQPLDVRSAAEARGHLGSDPAWATPVVATVTGWALRQPAALRLACKLGFCATTATAQKVALPLTVSLEAGLAVRSGVRELQVMSALLAHRLRVAGLPHEPELIRRAVASLYLRPNAWPVLHRPTAHAAPRIAGAWLAEAVPAPDLGRRRRARDRRLDAVEALDLHRLSWSWRWTEGSAAAEAIER